MLTSIIIRTYNEERHLGEVLRTISAQRTNGIDVETLVVDSGSTDNTVDIAKRYGCKILSIAKDEFSFGRSLNIGCAGAAGDILVFASGHCIPATSQWLEELIKPLAHNSVHYVYGRQIGNGDSKFSECQLFKKYFPELSAIPQEGFFCNNANAALPKDKWKSFRFDEDLTGLEDMDLAKRMVAAGLRVGYVATAPVYHLHNETWHKVKARYEREAIALQKIMPEVHLTFGDFTRYFTSAVLLDMATALQEKKLHKVFWETLLFRLMQYWGAYKGNHMHRQLSKKLKERYYYPK